MHNVAMYVPQLIMQNQCNERTWGNYNEPDTFINQLDAYIAIPSF